MTELYNVDSPITKPQIYYIEHAFNKSNIIFQSPIHLRSSPDYTYNILQVAALALLLVLEARCAHFVIAHFNNIVCCGVVHHCITYYTDMMTNLHITKM